MNKSELDRYFADHFNTAPQLRRERNVSDSYVRSIGLQFGNLRNMIRSDLAYQRASAAAGARGIVSEDNRMNIFLIIRYFLPKLLSVISWSLVPSVAVTRFSWRLQSSRCSLM